MKKESKNKGLQIKIGRDFIREVDKDLKNREKLIMKDIKERMECFACERKNNRKYGIDTGQNLK